MGWAYKEKQPQVPCPPGREAKPKPRAGELTESVSLMGPNKKAPERRQASCGQ